MRRVMGDIERAVALARDAERRIAALSHIGTHPNGNMLAALFELMRSNLSHMAQNAFELMRIAREHDLPMWEAFALILEGAAKAEGGIASEERADMRRGVELLRDQNVRIFDGLVNDPRFSSADQKCRSPAALGFAARSASSGFIDSAHYR